MGSNSKESGLQFFFFFAGAATAAGVTLVIFLLFVAVAVMGLPFNEAVAEVRRAQCAPRRFCFRVVCVACVTVIIIAYSSALYTTLRTFL